MTQRSRQYFIDKFVTGYTPTQEDFTDVFESVPNKETDVLPRVYKARLTQSGTDAPVATEIVNTLGEAPEFGYSDTGDFSATLVDMPEAKSDVSLNSQYNGDGEYFQSAATRGNNLIKITTAFRGDPTNGQLDGTQILTILIYP